jgi:hypothetical protein
MGQAPARSNYLDNGKLLEEILAYQQLMRDEAEVGRPCPKIPDSIGISIERTASGIASRPNFRGYTYIDEMTRDAIVDCVRAVKLFNVNKLGKAGKPNPFGYFSRIIWFAFLTRITSEKKGQKTKVDMMFDPTLETFGRMAGDTDNYYDNRSELLDFYYQGKLN